MSGSSLPPPPSVAPPSNRKIIRIGEPASAAKLPESELSSAAPARPRPLSRRARRTWSIVRGALLTVVVVAASVGTAVLARNYIVTSPRFALTSVEVSGNARRTPDEIAERAGLEKGANVFLLDTEAAREKLLADPFIRDATVVRRLPGTARVQVAERTPAALVALGDLYLSTEAGELFKVYEQGDPFDLPVITGLAPDDVATDREGAARSIRRALDVVAEYEHTPLASKAKVEEVHLDSANGERDAVTLIVGKQAIALALGQPPYRKKFEEAARALAEVDKRGGKVEAVLLDNEVRADRVVVRLKQ